MNSTAPARRRYRPRTVAVVTTAALGVTLGVAGITAALAATSGPITGFGGKCVDVAGANSANGTRVQLYECNGTSAQNWTASNAQLVNPGSGKCLDATGPSSADGTPLQIWTCTGGANQK